MVSKKGTIHHIELYVSNLKNTTYFWSWFLEELGYTLFQKWDNGQSWKLEDTYLVFVQTDEKFLTAPYHRRQVGLNHLAFWADSRQEVDLMTDKLRKKGIPILYADQHPFAGGKEHYAVFFEDPDRIKVEFVAPELS